MLALQGQNLQDDGIMVAVLVFIAVAAFVGFIVVLTHDPSHAASTPAPETSPTVIPAADANVEAMPGAPHPPSRPSTVRRPLQDIRASREMAFYEHIGSPSPYVIDLREEDR